MEYTIICKRHITVLTAKVNELLKEGWEVAGGASYGEYGYSQAMIKKKKRSPIKRFTPPTQLEVMDYSKTASLKLKGFYDYYESNNWKVGKNKMQDWKAAARNWSKRQQQFNPQETATPQPKTEAQQKQERDQEWKGKFDSEKDYQAHLFNESMAKYRSK